MMGRGGRLCFFKCVSTLLLGIALETNWGFLPREVSVRSVEPYNEPSEVTSHWRAGCLTTSYLETWTGLPLLSPSAFSWVCTVVVRRGVGTESKEAQQQKRVPPLGLLPCCDKKGNRPHGSADPALSCSKGWLVFPANSPKFQNPMVPSEGILENWGSAVIHAVATPCPCASAQWG